MKKFSIFVAIFILFWVVLPETSQAALSCSIDVNGTVINSGNTSDYNNCLQLFSRRCSPEQSRATDSSLSEACNALAIEQGTSLGYSMSCYVCILSWPFIDFRGFNHSYAPLCSVNGIDSFGADNLVGTKWNSNPPEYLNYSPNQGWGQGWKSVISQIQVLTGGN